MKEVTKKEFWDFIMHTTLNVHPYPEKDVTYWKTVNTGVIIGKSYPGYKLEGPEKFYLQ
jgi:hypothetical protein